jgi:hypothetical protein
VISVLLYGRNDAHGYNLHRRAALSLNCIAGVLTDSNDEIVFVDYNTPDELPTFIEALADTLTDRCLDLLRVIRVPAAIHDERFAGRTHLPALEPVARNAAVRRANPANRWLLSTNTDMIFLPHSDRSLTEICGELPDAFYGLPRFELPEWLWERLPRSDPGPAMDEIRRLGPDLRLDEPTLSNEWIRFDAPGDFQLVLREDFFAIDGFDEEMILGYHIDSNFSKRMILHRGSIESLEGELSGYHCNHNRTPTVYHGAKTVTNDLKRFFLSVKRAELPAQRETWGLVDEALEEVPIRERSGGQFADTVLAAASNSTGPRIPSDAGRVPFEPTYDSGHVLPFVADSIAVTPPNATIGYVGANPVLQESLEGVVAQLGGGRSLMIADVDEPSSVDEVARTADVFVVDLGLDRSLVSVSVRADQEPAELPATLAQAFLALERLVNFERPRVGRGEHSRRFVLVHSWTVFWDKYVLAHLDCSHTTAHSRVRRATVRPVPIDDELTRELVAQERRLIRWAARRELGRARFHLRPHERVELADLEDYGGFATGWAFPVASGLWTEGSRAEVGVALDGLDESGSVVAISLGSICVAREATFRATALANGETIAVREFRHGDPAWHLELPVAALQNGAVDLAFEIEKPGSPRELGWSIDDDRPLGLLFRTVELLPADDEEAQARLARVRRLDAWRVRTDEGGQRVHIRPRGTVDLTQLSEFGAFGNGWAYQGEAGVWTHGSRSRLALALDGLGESDYLLTFSLGSICTEPGSPLRVRLRVNGEEVAARELNFGDPDWQVELPAPAPAGGNVELTFEVDEPRSPVKLGWSEDDRPLGLLLHSVALDEVDRSVRPDERVGFGEGSGAERFLGMGWSDLEPTGVWTDGDRATLALRLTDGVPDDAELVLSVAPFVTPEHPVLEVKASVAGQQLATRVFRHDEAPSLLRVPVPPSVRGFGGRTVVELGLRDPASPADLGLGDDTRRLGVQLRWLLLRHSTWRATALDAMRETVARARGRLR